MFLTQKENLCEKVQVSPLLLRFSYEKSVNRPTKFFIEQIRASLPAPTHAQEFPR